MADDLKVQQGVRRRKRLRIALALADLNQMDLAKRYGVHPIHLTKVLTGERDSAPLISWVDEWIDRTIKEHRIAS